MRDHAATSGARLALALLLLAAGAPAGAQAAAATAPAPPPPPYSLPWLLRPAASVDVVRLDSVLADYEDATTAAGGQTFVESLILSYKVKPRLALVGRVSWVDNGPPSGPSGGGFSNGLAGVSYVRPLSRDYRLALFGASTIPFGAGGGDSPDAGDAAAMTRAIPARSAMDNALFAVNYWTVIGGVGVARVTRGLTAQAEVTVLQLTRVRGPESQDSSRTNFTAGLHLGHFFSPRVSVGAELRLQRWLSEAAPVRANPAAREAVTAAIGPRFHFKIGKKRWTRPGLSYSRALDEPLAGQGYDVFQLDVPIYF